MRFGGRGGGREFDLAWDLDSLVLHGLIARDSDNEKDAAKSVAAKRLLSLKLELDDHLSSTK